VYGEPAERPLPAPLFAAQRTLELLESQIFACEDRAVPPVGALPADAIAVGNPVAEEESVNNVVELVGKPVNPSDTSLPLTTIAIQTMDSVRDIRLSKLVVLHSLKTLDLPRPSGKAGAFGVAAHCPASSLLAHLWPPPVDTCQRTGPT
jgi:hypothetical protein